MFVRIILWFTYFLVVHISAQLETCIPNLEMLDASAKIPAGIMSGNLIDIGAYDQCLAIIGENKTKAKYCLVKLKLPTELVKASYKHSPDNRAMLVASDEPGIMLGWCIPEHCPIQNITNVISPILNATGITVSPVSQSGLCQTSDDLHQDLPAADWGVIGFLATIGAIMLLSTLYDIYCYYSNQEVAHIILIAFSLKTNGQKLLTVNKNPDQLPCLHGIRFLSMMWVIFGHTYATVFMETVINLGDLGIVCILFTFIPFAYCIKWSNTLANMYVINAPVSVDTFLVLSGLLVGYVFLTAKDKGIHFNIIMFYLHRYIRLTPALGVAILIHATILERLGSGPFWPFVLPFMKGSCTDYWWTSILYIQNYYNPEAICIGQTWYLSVDTQLFFLSPIILIPLWRWPKYTMFGCLLLVIGSMVSPFIASYYYDIPAFGVTPSPDYNIHYYYLTHTRFGPWVIGLMLGFYIFRLKKHRISSIRLQPFQVALGWIISLTVLFTTLYGGYNLMKDHNRIAIAFFNSMHRNAWALGVCWVIFACTQGYGGPINSFLSWSVFQVLSRFTYTMYLIHLSLQFMMAASARTPVYFSNFYNIHRFWSDFAITLFLAICLTISFESPMLTIEKVLFKYGVKNKKQELPIQQLASEQVNNGYEHTE